jgi:MFS family permease
MIFFILIGVPFWFLVYCVNFAPELSLNLTNGEFKVSQSLSIFFFLLGSLFGNIFIAYLTVKLKSRKKPIVFFFLLIPLAIIFYLYSYKIFFSMMYFAIFLLGLFTGYCSTSITFVTESFGTNMRSTASNLISNIGRLSIVFVNSFVPFLIASFASTTIGLFLSSIFIMFVAVLPLYFLIDTFHKSIDFQESEESY